MSQHYNFLYCFWLEHEANEKMEHEEAVQEDQEHEDKVSINYIKLCF